MTTQKAIKTVITCSILHNIALDHNDGYEDFAPIPITDAAELVVDTPAQTNMPDRMALALGKARREHIARTYFSA